VTNWFGRVGDWCSGDEKEQQDGLRGLHATSWGHEFQLQGGSNGWWLGSTGISGCDWQGVFYCWPQRGGWSVTEPPERYLKTYPEA
jgi:hypothetical protein